MLITAAAPPRDHVLDPQRACLHADRVYRTALRLTRSTHDAEDLAQETFAKVLAAPRVVHGDDLGYLLSAVRNTHYSAHRGAGRRLCAAVGPERLERLPGRSGDPHAAAEAREVVAQIARLPPAQREAIVAVDLLGYSYAEAAAAAGVPQGTIMSRLHRGRAAVANPKPEPVAELATRPRG